MSRSDDTPAPGIPRPGGRPRHALPRLFAVLARDGAERRLLRRGALAAVLVAVLVAVVHPLPAWCAGVAIAIRLLGGGQYTLAVARRRARPNVVTWLLWGLTPLIAVAAQLDDGPSPELAVTVALGVGPLVVAAVAACVDRSASRLTPFTLGCAAASVVGIALWRLTAMPVLATASCIVADLLATLPTLRKAWAAPDTEYAPPYLLSVVAMLITLGTVTHDGFTAYGFPLYMLLVNVVLFAFAAFPLARILRRLTPAGRRADRLPAAGRPRHGIPRGHRTAGGFGGFPVSTP